MYRLSAIVLFLSTAASGFVASPRVPTAFSQQGQYRQFAVSVDETVEAELSPEYAAAYDQAVAQIKAVLKDTKPELLPSLKHFSKEYLGASQASYLKTKNEAASPKAAVKKMLEGVQFGFKYGMSEDKYIFDVTHDALRGDPDKEDGNTFDFYAWGCDFFRPFMDMEESLVLGEDNLKKAMDQIAAGENVVFLANHQSEADPQVMSLMLEKAGYDDAAESVTYVAGHKVTTDPLAIPFSMGRNLICIHSKKHIDADPDTKPVKSRQNLAAMNGMLKKMKAGGCLLWVAPSGGRDRRDVDSGKTPIAPFDSKTIDMFRLMGNKSKKPTHYYPLAMVSYELCPPPDFIEAGVGEQRNFRYVPVGIKVGEELVSEGGLEQRHVFNEAAMERTLKDYVDLREKLFPGTAPEMDE